MFQPSASLIGAQIDGAFWVIAIMCAVLFVSIISLMAYFTVRYRRGRNSTPVDIEGHKGLETLFVATSVVIVLVMFYVGWRGYKTLFTEMPEGLFTIKATARQWSWSFEYPNKAVSERLYMPAGMPVRVDLVSTDIIHSFYVPAFRVKQDVVPGTVRTVWFQSDLPGEYDLFCAEYCGTGHSMMVSSAVVMDKAEFASWLEASGQEKAGKGAGRLDGERIFKAKGCSGCHTVDGSPLVCPTLKGVYGARVRVISNGAVKEVVADEAYLRRSILEPAGEVVEGFGPMMPSYKGNITDAEIEALAAYMKSLR